MTMRQYAKHRGVHHSSVSDAVAAGRIPFLDAYGKKLIDPIVADQEWDLNTQHEQRRHTVDHLPGQAPTGPMPIKNKLEKPLPNGTGQFEPGIMPPDTETDSGRELTYAKARAMNEHYKAQLAQLKFEQERSLLVEAAEVEKKWTQVANLVRTKVTGIPSKARQRIHDLTTEQYLELEKIVRESLEDLANEEET